MSAERSSAIGCRGLADAIIPLPPRRQDTPPRQPGESARPSGVHVPFADDQTTHHYASLFRQLRKQGTPIPTNDLWLAALVLQHNPVLHARDEHFDHLPQLVRV